MLDYAIITPARDEATHLPAVAENVLAQTVRPAAWVIVDNGSTDDTYAVAKRLATEHPWIRCLSIPGAERPTRGGPVVVAFEAGLDELEAVPAIVVKLDADVELPSDYFERLIGAFERDPALGVAAGTLLHPDGEEWRVRRTTATMVRAQARAYRRECLRGLLPLPRCVGWDHVDQLKSTASGWTNLEVPDLYFKHVRREGARDGDRYWSIQGAAAYYLGYRPTYVLLRALHRMPRDPGAARFISGYLSGFLHRSPRSNDRWVVAKTREQQQWSNLPRRIRELRGRSASRE